MQRISRAPVLSAILRRDSCWIIESPRSPGGLHDLGEPPALRGRKRPRLDDADDVADLRGVLFVVRVELDAAPDDLLVALVRGDQVDLDDDRLVHRARDDDATALLAAATIVLGLRLSDDRLPFPTRRHAAAPLLWTQPARQALRLLFRLWLRSGCFLLGGRLRRCGCLGGGFLGRRFLSRGLLSRRLLGDSLFGGRFLSRRLLSRRLLSRRLLSRRLLGGGLLSHSLRLRRSLFGLGRRL